MKYSAYQGTKHPNGTRMTDETREKIKNWYLDGITMREISNRTGHSISSVSRYINKYVRIKNDKV